MHRRFSPPPRPIQPTRQVILPLRSIVHNLRPVVEPNGHEGGQEKNVDGVETRTGVPENRDEGNGNNDNSGNSRSQNTGDNNNNNNGGKNTGDNNNNNNGGSSINSNSWKSLRGEVSGTFPAVDRRGRIPTDDSAAAVPAKTPLWLRLRLSVSLLLRPVSAWEHE